MTERDRSPGRTKRDGRENQATQGSRGLSTTNPDDADMALRARRGDRAAFAMLYARHQPMVTALCRRVLGDPFLAEDAVQEAALRAMLGISRLRRPEHFGAWLGGIGLNVCRDWLRRSSEVWSWETLDGGRRIDEPIAEVVDPADQAAEAEVAERVTRAVKELPSGQRAAVVRFYLEGLTLAETAAQLGIPPGAVKTRLHKARGNLRLHLRDMWEEHMTDRMSPEPVEVEVADVRRARIGDENAPAQHHVALQEKGGERTLIIWVGENEAAAIALQREGIAFPRPQTYQLTDRLLRVVGARVVDATVERLVGDTFYASIRVEGPGGIQLVDARPSDAINLALLAGAPMYVAEEVLAAAGGGGVPSGVVEHGPEIAARIVENRQKQMAAHLGSKPPSGPEAEPGGQM